MSPSRAVSVDRPPRARSAVSNGRRTFVEYRGSSAWARRFRDIVAEMAADMGGEETLSEAQRQLIRRCALLACEAERMEGQAVAGDEIDFHRYGQLVDRLGRAFQRLGMRRRARNVTTLGDILREGQRA